MQLNHQYYDTALVAESYAKNERLQVPEQFIFDYLKSEIGSGKLLDIGVGAGRTTGHLLPLCESYIGIDYSQQMLAQCRKKFPQADLQFGDARDLDFPANSFDIVLCSFNAIDDFEHEDRLRILHEVKRVLRPQGWFIFSTHNPKRAFRSAWKMHNFAWKGNPVALMTHNARELYKYYVRNYNRARNKRKEVHTETYSMINDQSYSFRLLTYFITKENQIKQLQAVGFKQSKIVSRTPEFITVDTPCADPWIYYIAQKQ